ncbi:MAG: PEP-CTERM system histidine kinase PrsK [Herminiimonas sp.]|nr:PEP-CTERM system histidine kinase PrsK [Herminiimonas sp.]
MLTNIALFSYGSTAVAFFVLTILLLTRWRGNVHGVVMTFACVTTAIWATVIGLLTMAGSPMTLLSDLLEILRNACWTLLLVRLMGPFKAGKPHTVGNFKWSVIGIAALYVLMLLATLDAYRLFGQPLGLANALTSTVGHIAMAVVGMLMVEQLYRNTPAEARWAIKFACMGMGGLFAYDFYLYSDAMLFRLVNAEIWVARGAINALTAPLIALSVARNPKWSLGIAVSRRVAFHSVALFGSAIYLLTMSAAGYYLRYFGGSWGSVMQGVFLFGALLLLVAVLFSGTFRSWLKVFISKHFYSYGYDYREEWMRFTRTLSDDGRDLTERTIQAVANLVESPGGALYVSREGGQCELAGQTHLPDAAMSEPLSSAFCEFLQAKQWVIDLAEYRDYPENYDSVPLPDWLMQMANAALIVPLILHGGLTGFIVLVQPRSRIVLNWEVTDLLKIAGNQAASYLTQQESARALMVARQFESFNRMSTFMVHDLKNLVSQLSLMVANAERHKDNPEFQRDMLETVDLSVQKMKLLLQKLARGTAVEPPSRVRLDKLLQEAVANKTAVEPKPVLELIDADLMVTANTDRLARVIGHIIQNAVEATPRDGRVTVRLIAWHAEAIIECIDTGCGMSEEFIRERLFQPFESTKSAGMGIGVFESREYIQELGGRIEVSSRPGAGTTFRIVLPLQRQPDAADHNELQAA